MSAAELQPKLATDVVALYVDPKGPYPGLVAEWYDADRDAKTYDGNLPVVAHPPCGPWSSLRTLSRETTKGCAPHAVDIVRRLGGVRAVARQHRGVRVQAACAAAHRSPRGVGLMLRKQIVWFGDACTLACDGRCDKAWGINGRPRHSFDPNEPDDYVYLADSKLDVAPGPGRTVGLSEGGHLKPSATPLADPTLMNKWCSRECERSTIAEAGEAVCIPDLEHPSPNMLHRRHAQQRSTGGGG